MSLKIKMEKKADYLLATFSGEADLQEAGNRFEFMAVRCRSAKKNKLLMNIAAINVVPTFSERFRIGEKMVIFSEFGIKVAVVASPEQIEPRRLAELVAQNRGVDVHIFLDLASAEVWLLEEPAK